MNKYRNKPTVVDGIRFASIRESVYYGDLRLLERAGKISDLTLQPSFAIVWPGTGAKICRVVGDFMFLENGRDVVVDVKGKDNAMSKLKRKLVKAAYPDIEWRVVK